MAGVKTKSVVTTALTGNEQNSVINQRVGFKTSLDVYWIAVMDDATNDSIRFFYSTNGTSGWTEDTAAALTDGTDDPTEGSINESTPPAVFCDVDDRVWIIYQAGEPNMAIRWGTLNGSHTAITWTTNGPDNGWYIVGRGRSGDRQYDNRPDMVITKGSGSIYYQHVVSSAGGSSTSNTHIIQYQRITWDFSEAAGSEQTASVSQTIGNFMGSVSKSAFPCIDFHHTGDGKTIKGGSPHIFVWHKNLDDDPHFTKVNYNGSGWDTPDSEVKLATFFTNTTGNVLFGRFDGTRCVGAFEAVSSNATGVYERDVANTTTTDISPSGVPAGFDHEGILLTINQVTQDIILWAVDQQNSPNELYWREYDRSGASWDGSWTDPTYNDLLNVTFGNMSMVEAIGSSVMFMYLDSTVTTINAVHESFNSDPTIPELENPQDGAAYDVNAGLFVEWVFNDPDPGDTQSAYTVRRQVDGGAFEYWNGSTWDASESASTKIAASSVSFTIPSSWGTIGEVHSLTVKTWDAADAGPSPWATVATFDAVTQSNPSLTAPADAGTVTAATDTVSWTVGEQSQYRVVVSDTSGGFIFDGNLDYDSGWVSSTGTRSVVATFPTNGVTRYVKVQTFNGVYSNIDEHSVTVSYTPPTPATPVVTVVPGQWITVEVDDSSASTDIASYEIHRRVVGDTGNGRVLETGIPEGDNSAPYYTHTDYTVASGIDYEYRIKAIGDNGSAAFSAWVD